MKRFIYFIALLTAIASIASAQQIDYNVTKVLTGEWKWISYEGGADKVACSDATGHYVFTMNRVQGAPGLFYDCTVFKNNSFLYTTRMLVTQDASNPAFPYKLLHDVTAPLFTGMAQPSVNFRIVENDIIEFSNGITTDYRYLFKNINANGGC